MDQFNLFDQSVVVQDFESILFYMGQQVNINGQPQRVLITNTNLNTDYDDRKITAQVPLQRGDIVEFNGNRYMVISQVNDKRYEKYKAIIRRLTHSIIFNLDCRFVTAHGYIEASNLDLIEGRILSLPTGQIKVLVSQRTINAEIKNGIRFMLDGHPFVITGVDPYTQPGIVILTCQLDQITQYDDVINNIAGLFGCTINLVPEQKEIQVGQSFALEYSATGNTPVAFVSSNPEVATVDQHGVVTGISEGQAVITVYNSTRVRQ